MDRFFPTHIIEAFDEVIKDPNVKAAFSETFILQMKIERDLMLLANEVIFKQQSRIKELEHNLHRLNGGTSTKDG